MHRLRRKPRAIRPLIATAVLVFLAFAGMGQGTTGQTMNGVSAPEPIDWRWAMTQGGLTVVVIVLAWSYRKDMGRWADDRVSLERELAEQRTAFAQAKVDDAIRYDRRLEELIRATNTGLEVSSAAMLGHTTALALNTECSRTLASMVGRLDDHIQRMDKRRE